MSQYQVKNVKTFRGREGQGFNATLYCDGKKVAQVDDSANGGCYDWHWLDWQANKVPVTFKNYNGSEYTRNATPNEAAFIEFLKSKGLDGEFEFEDSYVNELVCEFIKMRDYKRWCKKETLFRLKSEKYEDGAWRTLKVPFSDPRAKKYLQDKYGDDVQEILNERIA